MITKKVPVVLYDKNANRTVVGQAVVEIEGDAISVDARVNLDHVIWTENDMQFSLGPFTAPKSKKEK